MLEPQLPNWLIQETFRSTAYCCTIENFDLDIAKAYSSYAAAVVITFPEFLPSLQSALLVRFWASVFDLDHY